MSQSISRLIGKRIADRYCITGEIGSGGMGRVLRAISFSEPTQDVAIKVIHRRGQMGSEDLLRFQKEAAVMARLFHQNIICFHELGLLSDEKGDQAKYLGSGYYIVMEYAQGTNLKDALQNESRRDLEFFFEVALQVAAALDYTHGKNIIHRDIKPQNIVVGQTYHDQKNLTVKVLDFGVARLAEAINFSGSQGGFEEVAGTPVYMAPEQTSLMQAPVDHRVDLYSLGCVLYEILSGRPPFTGGSREKLARQHVYETVEPLSNLRPDVPLIIEQIINKLLSKHPRDRYQSAFAAQADLERVRRRIERGESPSGLQFPLALNDRFQSVSARIDLVGRQQELEDLKHAFAESAKDNGRSRLSVVSGQAGSGKTRLIAEFRSYLAKAKVRFVSANFSRHENALRFNALANGINEYLLQLYKSHPIEADEFRRRVKTYLGQTAYMLAKVIPGLYSFIDSAIPRPDQVDEDDFDYNTFAKAFSDFVRCFAVDHHPVVFIFDDLQWADEASIGLIDRFFSHNNSQKFFLVLSFRELTASSQDHVARFINKFSKLRRRFERINLGPFDPKDVGSLCENLLVSNQPVDSDLVDYIVERSRCNPLHVIELVRKLVSSDLIFLRTSSGRWNYDVNQIRSSAIVLDSVDLVLNRLQDFSPEHRRVLENASAAGLSFAFHLLNLDGELDAQHLESLLKIAQQEGLISRVPELNHLRHLGRAFAFNHPRIRDAIYTEIDVSRRQSLHQSLAEKLLSSNLDDSHKSVFAVTHHLNQVFELGECNLEYLAQKCFEFNIKSGHAAWDAGALQAAQRYFENIESLMPHLGLSKFVHEQRLKVSEALADLDVLQRRHGAAIKKYRQAIIDLPQDRDKIAVALKLNRVQLLGGLISNARRVAIDVLELSRLPLPRQSWLFRWRSYCELLRDLVSANYQRSRIHKMLNNAYILGKDQGVEEIQAAWDHPSEAYSHLLLTQIVEDPIGAFCTHSTLYRLGLKGRLPLRQTIQVAGERAVLLSMSGRFPKAYQGIETAVLTARKFKLHDLAGYLYLLRALFLDYPRYRSDELTEHMRYAYKLLNSDFDRLWQGQNIVFRLFLELMRGDVAKVERIAHSIPETIPTRSWLSCRAMAMTFFLETLKDRRDLVSIQAERYLQRRKDVAARSDDAFVHAIETCMHFSRGDLRRCRRSYLHVMRHFLKSHSQRFMLPFEDHFLAMFIYTFPMLIEQDLGERLLSEAKLKTLFSRMATRISKLRKDGNPIATALRARSRDMIGSHRAHGDYDAALTSAKAGGSQFLLGFSYLWFGDYLLRSGNQNRQGYLLRAQKIFHSCGLNAMTAYVEKVMVLRGIQFDTMKPHAEDVNAAVPAETTRTDFAFEHLVHLCAVMRMDTPFEMHFDESVAIIKRTFKFKNFALVIPSQDGERHEVAKSSYSDSHEFSVLEYVSPYLNIRSTLFLPILDAPWVTTLENDRQHIGTTLAGETLAPDSKNKLTIVEAVDETVVLDNEPEGDRRGTLNDLKIPTEGTEANTSTTYALDSSQQFSSRKIVGLRMHALVPIRTREGNAAILFLEDVHMGQRDTASCRQELDYFGTHIGMMYEQKVLGAQPKGNTFEARMPLVYSPGQYHLEPVSWLKLWTKGRMRSSRETGWFAGFAVGDDAYLLYYLRLNGDAEVRERLGQLLWYQTQSFRTSLTQSSRQSIELNEVKDEIVQVLRKFQQTRQLEQISVAFSVFQRSSQTVLSGHIGPSRPTVIGQENRVRPQNEAIMSLANGRDLRFWTVQSNIDGSHLYLLAHDTSKIDLLPPTDIRRTMENIAIQHLGNAEVQAMIERLLPEENIPRYYVAAAIEQVDAQILAFDRSLLKAE